MEPIKFNKKNLEAAVDIQKVTMKAICDLTSKDENEGFNEAMLAFVMIISNFMNSKGINRIDLFLDDLVKNVKRLYPGIKKNASCYYIKEDGEIKEGMIQ